MLSSAAIRTATDMRGVCLPPARLPRCAAGTDDIEPSKCGPGWTLLAAESSAKLPEPGERRDQLAITREMVSAGALERLRARCRRSACTTVDAAAANFCTPRSSLTSASRLSTHGSGCVCSSKKPTAASALPAPAISACSCTILANSLAASDPGRRRIIDALDADDETLPALSRRARGGGPDPGLMLEAIFPAAGGGESGMDDKTLTGDAKGVAVSLVCAAAAAGDAPGAAATARRPRVGPSELAGTATKSESNTRSISITHQRAQDQQDNRAKLQSSKRNSAGIAKGGIAHQLLRPQHSPGALRTSQLLMVCWACRPCGKHC
jgi:hypothetical protein